MMGVYLMKANYPVHSLPRVSRLEHPFHGRLLVMRTGTRNSLARLWPSESHVCLGIPLPWPSSSHPRVGGELGIPGLYVRRAVYFGKCSTLSKKNSVALIVSSKNDERRNTAAMSHQKCSVLVCADEVSKRPR